jgi:DNA-binding MarR family transcriptional regulator
MDSKPKLKSPRSAPRKSGPSATRSSMRKTAAGPVLDLDKYVPGLFTLITSNLSGGASAAYLSLYAVGIETWRVMVMLAIEGRVTAQRVVQLLGVDKGAVSRTFKTMNAEGWLRLEPDAHDLRVRYAVMTPKGRALHDRMIRLALLREAVALSVLSDAEVQILRDLLRRVNAGLPDVEAASGAFIQKEREALGLPANAPALRRRGGPRSDGATSDVKRSGSRSRS